MTNTVTIEKWLAWQLNRLHVLVLLLFYSFEGGVMYWKGSERLHILALRAAMTGESLDQLFFEDSTRRIFSARSMGSLSHLPRMRKSSVTPNRSTSKAAVASVIALFPFSNLDQ